MPCYVVATVTNQSMRFGTDLELPAPPSLAEFLSFPRRFGPTEPRLTGDV